MSHFAKVNQGKVIQVIVAEQDFIDNFVDTTPGKWIQTSYNTYGGVHYDPLTGEPSEDQSKALRYNFAMLDGNYDATADAFYAPQAFSSWTLNTNTYLWEAPVALPDDAIENGGDVKYRWNEETTSWDAVE
jgi:hypothetical protein